MFSFGTGSNEDDEESKDFSESVALRWLMLLQEHGWDFTYGRDPVLILIEYEETHNSDNKEPDEP